MYVGVRHVMHMVECACVYVCVFRGAMENAIKGCISHALLLLEEKEGFLEAADGTKYAAVKLEENQRTRLVLRPVKAHPHKIKALKL